jgi:hypothetical protein
MNLNDLYEMRDPRDAYERDIANSTSGFGKDSQAYRADGGANDENHNLDQQSSTWYIRLNGKLIKDKSGNPYSFQDKAAANKAARTMQAKLFNKDKEFMLTTNPNDKPQGMAEGSQRVDSIVTDALKIMKGSGLNDAVQALKTVLGDREYNDRRGHYNFYVRQLMDMYGQQDMAEAGTLDRYRDRIGTSGQSDRYRDSQERDHARRQDHYDAEHQSRLNRVSNSDQMDAARTQHEIDVLAHRLSRMQKDDDDWEKTFDMMRDRLNRYQWSSQRDVDPEQLAAISNIKYEPRKKNETVQAKTDDKLLAYYAQRKAEKQKQSQQGVAEAEVDSDGHSVDHADSGEYDYEGDQAKDQLNTIVRAARRLDGLLDDNENMPEWVQMKITNAADYIDTAADYIESNQEPELEEGWRETLGAAALTGAMALGAGGAQARVMPGDDPGINRLTGKPIATQQATDTAPTQSTSSINLAKPQAQYDVDTRILTYKGKQYKWNSDAQATGQGEVVTAPSMAVGSRSMGSTKVELNPNGTYTRAPANESQEKVGNMDADAFDAAMARLKQLAGAGPMKTVYDPAKRVYRNVPVAVQPKK